MGCTATDLAKFCIVVVTVFNKIIDSGLAKSHVEGRIPPLCPCNFQKVTETEPNVWVHNWATLRLGDIIQRPGSPGQGFNARMMILLCKKITVMRSKEVKTICNLTEYSKDVSGAKRFVLPILLVMGN
jgi:hypothetical protein